MAAHHPQDDVHAASLRDPEAFWSAHARSLHWHKPPSRALALTTKTLPNLGEKHRHWSWFPDGEINTSYNCIDRHVHAGNGDAVAIIWDSPVSGSKEKITYRQLLHEVEVLAGVLREEGVKKGDVVLIYSELPCDIHNGRKLKMVYSANDPCCFVCHAGRCPLRRHPCCCFRWLLFCCSDTADRGVPAERHNDCFLWHRGRQRPSRLSATRSRRCKEEQFQDSQDDYLAARPAPLGSGGKG